MSIKLYQKNNRYLFSVDNIFRSWRDFYLVPRVSPDYEHMWQAYHAASTIVENSSYHLDAIRKQALEDLGKPLPMDMSAEQMLVNHYMDILELMSERAKDAKGDAEKSNIVYLMMRDAQKEIETVIEKITDDKDRKKLRSLIKSFYKTIKKYFPKKLAKDEQAEAKQRAAPDIPVAPAMPPAATNPAMMATASLMTSGVASGLRDAVLRHYAERSCIAIQHHHKNFIYQIRSSSMSILISSIVNKHRRPILKIQVNDNLMMTDAIPLGDTARMYPYHTGYFYQLYWKPIVESVGHIVIEDFPVLLKCHSGYLPDMPSSGDMVMPIEGWNIKKGCKQTMQLAFKGDAFMWMMDDAGHYREASSKYTEMDYMHSMVRCTDATLKTLYGKIGEVIQVIPLADHVEVDVNFGRQVVRLTESQIEIINS